MKFASQTGKRLETTGKTLWEIKKKALKNGKVFIAGAAAAVVAALNHGRKVFASVVDFKDELADKNKKSKGEITMKKSTFVTLLVVFAAVAGALGALYFYVLRREKELDEYEQLLFSEDFNDEILAEQQDLEPVAEEAAE